MGCGALFDNNGECQKEQGLGPFVDQGPPAYKFYLVGTVKALTKNGVRVKFDFDKTNFI